MHVLPKVPKALGRVPGSRAPFALLSLDPPPPPNNNHSAPHRFHHPHTTVTSPYFLHSPDSQCRQFANTLASPVPSFVQCPAPTLLPRPASSSMASRLLQVHSPASLNTLEAQSDPHTPSKMQGQQLCISEFFAANPASPPSSTLLQTRSRGNPRCFEIYAGGQGSRPIVHNILVFCWPEWHHSGLRNVSDC